MHRAAVVLGQHGRMSCRGRGLRDEYHSWLCVRVRVVGGRCEVISDGRWARKSEEENDKASQRERARETEAERDRGRQGSRDALTWLLGGISEGSLFPCVRQNMDLIAKKVPDCTYGVQQQKKTVFSPKLIGHVLQNGGKTTTTSIC